ncbi:GTPase ObgE [Candidatus Synchoanobacter obligatus]|uniref:GTPase Obg n=1 Tax=Candidatus Synchoanobacter obligatus TaxID=2919597 RepID=A0ABT1L5F8_9GAMM|nr:GTPase ObgE [Candidatus Synchoanobacter obligatus]MCP8352404.1 GTPase ObgE [Candidatus Synchoanobacter obligatus]
MSFIDQATILCSAGSGGNGCVSFRREKCIPLGGPNGGDGGKGGSIILKVTHQTNSLASVQRLHHVRAKGGQNGLGSQKNGRAGEDTIIEVPQGTCVFDADAPDAPIIIDLCQMDQTYTIARGGEGGLGNIRFKSSTNRAPRKATKGDTGEELRIRLELRVLADVGLLGLPNAGKSSLLRKVSGATPKVANYAFTTTKPHVGVVHYHGYKSFVMADIPGLIKGAADGHGMGDRFLKHLMRCRVLLHVVDATLPIDEQIIVIEEEIRSYGHGLLEKPRCFALNKVDAVEDTEALLALFPEAKVFPISALSGQGVEALIDYLGEVCA